MPGNEVLSTLSLKTVTSLDVAAMRKPYKNEQEMFDVEDLVAKEPYAQFTAWFEEAASTKGIMEANAMTLATATKDGKPSIRMVLLKGYDSSGFKFYSNYSSRKGKEIEENPNVSLMVYWEPLLKMIRIEGTVECLSEEESTEYFHSRPRTSQIGACISHQSSLIPNKQVLSQRYEELKTEYTDESKVIPKPEYWGGYLVKPEFIEFWQGQTNRLHDRIRFRKLEPGEKINPTLTQKGEDGWVFERLSP